MGDGRLERIAAKLAEARNSPVALGAFGVRQHGFVLGPPAPEAAVVEFERRHGIALPASYRAFISHLGHDGAGPGYGLSRFPATCCAHRATGHLARPSPYLPGPRYADDWEKRYEEPPAPDRISMPGTLEVASHGCTLLTLLVVTGPARGRLINVDTDGPVGPYVVEDVDFLAWYERWLDEAIAGHDVGFFGERLPLDEAELLAVLAGDPAPDRRARAAESVLSLRSVGDHVWTALTDAMTTDADATVRATVWDLLRWKVPDRPLADADGLADRIAAYARSSAPPDLTALGILRTLTFADVLPDLDAADSERRRRAAYALAWERWEILDEYPFGGDHRDTPLDAAVGRLLDDPDALVRSHAVAAVHWFGLDHRRPRVRAMRDAEADPWTRSEIDWCLSEKTSTRVGRSGTVFDDDPPF